MNNPLMLVLGCMAALPLCAQRTRDSVAIQRLLERESATWRAGDVAGHAACWQLRPYSRILVTTGDGRVIDVPPLHMVQPPAGSMGKGGYALLSDIRMHISRRQAWVSHSEVSVATDSSRTRSYEMRMLEKVGGRWKLVGQSIQVVKP